MKKFLAVTLVLMLMLCFLPGIAPTLTAYAVNTDRPAPAVSPDVDTKDAKNDGFNYAEAPWKLFWGKDEEGLPTAFAVNYVLPVSDDGVIEYNPGSWYLDQMLNRLDTIDLTHRYILLTAGSSGPVAPPALAAYSGGEAGEPSYSALFRLPGQDEGRSFPDRNIDLVISFPGDITVRIPAQELSSVISAIDLKVYGDRLVVDLAGAEDAEAYIQVPCTGTPLWIDAEGNEVEAEYEYDEAGGIYKIAVKSGLTLVFKA